MSSEAVPPPSANEALTPAPSAVARFARDLETLTGAAPSAERRLGVAVSGGADSLALLLLAAAAYPGAVVAATVDHGLRPEAAEEAAGVAALCRRMAVPHDILVRPGNMVAEGNLQEQARLLRYALLTLWAGSGTLLNARPWRAEWVATAHQQDDLAENLLMRARRGAGLRGLAAMAAARPIDLARPASPFLVRPLLHWPRADLADLVAAARLTPVDDPANIHPRFDRSRIRALIATHHDLPADQLATAARNLRHAEDALAWAVDREWAARAEEDGYYTVWLDVAGLPYEIKRRLVRRAIDTLRFEYQVAGVWRGTGLDRFVAALGSGSKATLAGIIGIPGPRWRFTEAPPRRS